MKNVLLSLFVIFAFTNFARAQSFVLDFEDGTWGRLTPHVMGNGEWDNNPPHAVEETFLIVNNPDISGINQSMKVMQFTRRGTTNGGLPWGGFWANVAPPLDLTTDKYVHVKVYKPRISPLHYKVEGGTTVPPAFELPSLNSQTTPNVWEEIIFYFPDATGTYPVTSFMPDFEDPLTITGDITIYFDDIEINNDPNVTGINDPKAIMFAVYPNPVTTTLNIANVRDASKVTVTNILGQQVMNYENLNTGILVVNTDQLVKGMYIVNVYKNGNVASKKFLKD
jgi:hypothetical protein